MRYNKRIIHLHQVSVRFLSLMLCYIMLDRLLRGNWLEDTWGLCALSLQISVNLYFKIKSMFWENF